MIIKIYQQYLIKSLLKWIFLISGIFLILSFLLNIIEEIRFFKNLDLGISYSFLLTFLNVPSILYEIFPFIFLISTQMFFVNLFEKEVNSFFGKEIKFPQIQKGGSEFSIKLNITQIEKLKKIYKVDFELLKLL